MESLINFKIGLEILEPFLIKHGFYIDNFKNGLDSHEQFLESTYKNGNKKLVFIFRLSLRQVVYQYENSSINHDFYLDQLGFADKRRLKDVQFDDKLQPFKNVLLDFEYLLEDFFDGECTKLIKFFKLKVNYIKPQEKLILEARQLFSKKDFNKCLEIYRSMEDKTLFIDLDKKLIEYCEQHI